MTKQRENPTHVTWRSIKQRCEQLSHHKFRQYGFRGIIVEWATYTDFVRDMGERPAQMTLDRINPQGNYSKDNCRWVTHQEQVNNQRPRRPAIEVIFDKAAFLMWQHANGVRPTVAGASHGKGTA